MDFWTKFEFVTTVDPTQAQIDSYLAQADTVVGPGCTVAGTGPTGCYAILDARKRNFANVKLDGLDMALNYRIDAGFASFDLGFNANYELNREQQAIAGVPFSDLLEANNSRFKFSTVLGATISGLRAQVTWNHTAGYDLDPAVSSAGEQDGVKSFNVFNLFFKYDVPGQGIFENLSFSLNVDNIFGQDPPRYIQQSITASQDGYINGNTIGRFVQFGVSKQF